MMEGSYNKVFLARESAPAASYNAFLDVLEDAIRDSIADGCAAAYARLKLSAFVGLLFAKSEMDIDHLLQQVRAGLMGYRRRPLWLAIRVHQGAGHFELSSPAVGCDCSMLRIGPWRMATSTSPASRLQLLALTQRRYSLLAVLRCLALH